LTIRPATLGDRDALLRMARAFVSSKAYGFTVDVEAMPLGALVEHCVKDGIVFVAEWPEGVHGMIAAQSFVHPVTGELTVTELAWWVDPEKRGTSAAIRLLNELHAAAVGLEAAVMQMVEPLGRPDIADIYARVGFEPIETTWQRRLAA
jgi:hypothetical protein